jgi:hypothetical protein
MAIGQGVLGAAALDVAELDRVAERLAERERERSRAHAAQLVDVLALHRLYGAAGMSLATTAYVALLLNCSEHRARMLLCDAQVLERLGALGPMSAGVLTVEQSRVVVDLLGPLDEDLAGSLWERLAARLRVDAGQEVVRPPARLRELLRRWVIAADPEAFEARRRASAELDADVEVWKRDDGLVDLAARALSPTDAQACIDRIEQLAQPSGPDDTRTAGQRRRQAVVDLLTGRIPLLADAVGDDPAGCCPPGSSAPCGAHVFVHVPLATAQGDSDEPAELVGHGPIDPGELADLLDAGAVLHRVWVDERGVPIAVDDGTWQAPRDDPAALRLLLTRLGDAPSGPSELTHAHGEDVPASWDLAERPPPLPPPREPEPPRPADAGAYRPTARQKWLVRARAPRCEWPGCGHPASRGVAAGCDVDHDIAWPLGPTCACNLGPLCRRHHRIKQLGWRKARRPDGSVRWTSPDRHAWTSPHQHSRPGALPRGARRIAPGVWTVPHPRAEP